MKNEESTEAMIQQKGLTGRRLSPDDIDRVIVGEQFLIFQGSMTTVCQLKLANGFTVTGESACVSPENFNVEVGEKVARENARAKVWQLEGYRLKEACYRGRELETYPVGQEPQDSLDVNNDTSP